METSTRTNNEVLICYSSRVSILLVEHTTKENFQANSVGKFWQHCEILVATFNSIWFELSIPGAYCAAIDASMQQADERGAREQTYKRRRKLDKLK